MSSQSQSHIATDSQSVSLSVLVSYPIGVSKHTHSFYRLDTDCIENTSSSLLLGAMFIVQLPSNKLQWCIHYCCPSFAF
jgi:hypothetical protein